MNERIDALVIIKTDKPFKGIIRVNVIEKFKGKYVKKTIAWEDDGFNGDGGFGRRYWRRERFFYAPGDEQYCGSNNQNVPPRFFSFIKTSDTPPLVDEYGDEVTLLKVLNNIQDSAKETRFRFFTKKTPKCFTLENGRTTMYPTNKFPTEMCQSNFFRILLNIQAVSPFITESVTQTALKAHHPTTVEASKNEIATFERYKEKCKDEMPHVQYTQRLIHVTERDGRQRISVSIIGGELYSLKQTGHALSIEEYIPEVIEEDIAEIQDGQQSKPINKDITKTQDDKKHSLVEENILEIVEEDISEIQDSQKSNLTKEGIPEVQDQKHNLIKEGAAKTQDGQKTRPVKKNVSETQHDRKFERKKKGKYRIESGHKEYFFYYDYKNKKLKCKDLYRGFEFLDMENGVAKFECDTKKYRLSGIALLIVDELIKAKAFDGNHYHSIKNEEVKDKKKIRQYFRGTDNDRTNGEVFFERIMHKEKKSHKWTIFANKPKPVEK